MTPFLALLRQALRSAQQWLAAWLLLGVGALAQTSAQAQVHSLTISGEAAQGQYQDDVTRQTSSNALFCTFCGTGYSVKRMGYYHSYALAGGTVAYNRRSKSATGIHSIGLGIRGGSQRTGFRPQVPDAPFDAAKPAASVSFMLYDINPYVEGRAKWSSIDLGYRAGLHVGRLRNKATIRADSSLLPKWLAPDVKLWMGKRRVLFAQFDSGVGPLALGNHTSRFGLGSGLGSDDGRYLLLGMAVARHESGYNMGFIGASIPVFNSGLSVEPYAATDFARHHQTHFRLSYDIPSSLK